MSLETDKIIVTIIILLFLFPFYIHKPTNTHTYIHKHKRTISPSPLPKSTPTSDTHHPSQLQSQLITNIKTQMHIILQFIVSPILFCILDPLYSEILFQFHIHIPIQFQFLICLFIQCIIV